MKAIQRINTDILVLGTGLAGMKAAVSALKTRRVRDVMLVSNVAGPSGSSFSNINDALGMQVCISPEEKGNFINTAVRIARPGIIEPSLVEIMAEESVECFAELRKIGFNFRRNNTGDLLRLCGCFLQSQQSAFIFTKLHGAFSYMKRYTEGCGGCFVAPFTVRGLLFDAYHEKRVVTGALLESCRKDNKMLVVNAKAVILAIGGPASGFKHNISACGATDQVLSLFKQAGVKTVNEQFFQFLWYELKNRCFLPVQSLCTVNGCLVKRGGAKAEPVPDYLSLYASARASHCPIAYGMQETCIDLFLLKRMNKGGWVEVFMPEIGWIRLTPMAQAWNGGALIDRNGRTNVQGLYACGECAGGMHGANRIGGAMVLSTQVFGRRAGMAAAKYASKQEVQRGKDITDMAMYQVARANPSCHTGNIPFTNNDYLLSLLNAHSNLQ